MYLESFHRSLKKDFLTRDATRRLDSLIHVLLNEVSVFYVNNYVRQCGLSKVHNCQRQSLLHDKHRRMAVDYRVTAEDFDPNAYCRRLNGLWEVKSASREDVVHRVTLIRPEGCLNCRLKCRFCDVCPHLYLCSCEDSVSACKHIHLIHRSYAGDMSSSGEADVNVEFTDDPAGPGREVFVALKEKEREKKTNQQESRTQLEAKLHAAAGLISSAPDCLLPQLQKKIADLVGLLKLSKVSTFPSSVERDVHQNQKMDKQLLQFPRRKKRKAVRDEMAENKDPFAELERKREKNEREETLSLRICSMAECAVDKKFDDRLDWITCEVCSRSFHFVCVGKFVGENGVLVCKNCTKVDI